MPAAKGDTTWNGSVQEGDAFAAENLLVGVAGVQAHIQIFNPAASGIRVRVRSVHAVNSVVQGVNLRRHDVPLATLGVPAGNIVENLLGGQPTAIAEMRSSAPIVSLGTLFWQVTANANEPAIYPAQGREWGYDLLEGEGILVQAGAAVTLTVNWQWVEVPL